MENNEERTTLSKEEILAKSRKENENGDEREQQALYRAGYAATSIGFFLYGIISVVLAALGRHSYEMNIVVFAIIGTMYTILGLNNAKHKRVFLTSGIVCILSSVTTLVCWILELCGVV